MTSSLRASLGAGALAAWGALGAGCAASLGQPTIADAVSAHPLLPARIRRLSNAEYERSASELLGMPLDLAGQLPPEVRQSGYTRNADQTTSSEGLARLDQIVSALAHDAVRARAGKLAPCATKPGAACVARTVESFGSRAFRHPLAPDERQRLLTIFAAGSADGAGFAGGLEALLRTLLVSPSFLYTTELGEGATPGARVALTIDEIASEIAFTVRGGPPDAELLAAARAGLLRSGEERARHARRLIAASDTRDQFQRFVLEWLEVDGLEQTAKAPSVIADYDELKPHFLDETKAFVDQVLVYHGATVRALLTAGFASVDPVMARFYGLHSYGPEASLGDSGRLGVLQQASFLSTHAHDDSSSPIKRGDFVLRRLLCEPVKRPGEVGIDIVLPPAAPTLTTRARFDVHTASAACSGCHQQLDQLGFSFENFDAAGQLRQTENARPIDTSAEIWRDGRSLHFVDSRDLSRYLAKNPRVEACFARQAFRFFSGSSAPGPEQTFVDLARGLPDSASGNLLEELVAFVASDLFIEREVLP